MLATHPLISSGGERTYADESSSFAHNRRASKLRLDAPVLLFPSAGLFHLMGQFRVTTYASPMDSCPYISLHIVQEALAAWVRVLILVGVFRRRTRRVACARHPLRRRWPVGTIVSPYSLNSIFVLFLSTVKTVEQKIVGYSRAHGTVP